MHGEAGVEAAERISTALFSNQLASLEAEDLAQLAMDGLPSSQLTKDSNLIDVLVESGLAITPRGEVTVGQARKLIKSNAVSVDGVKVSDQEFVLKKADALHGRFHVVQKGKKNHHMIVMD